MKLTIFRKCILLFSTLSLMASLSVWQMPGLTRAADLRSGDTVTIEESEQIDNGYLAGNEVVVKSKQVNHDLLVAAATSTIASHITGSLMVAGSEMTIASQIDGSARLAGAEITLNSQVGGDVLLLAGKAVIDKGAVIEGDVLFAGGQLIVNGQVKGKVVTYCDCQVEIDGTVGSFEGYRVGALKLGPAAVVKGNLTYRSASEATIDREAVVEGVVDSQSIYGHNPGQTDPWNNLSVYNLLASLIFALILILLLPKLTQGSLQALDDSWLKSAGVGLAILVAGPIVATLLLAPSLWLGIVAWLGLVALFMTSLTLGQVVLGYWVLRWWQGKYGQRYVVDWRAAVLGVLGYGLIMLVPIVGGIVSLGLILLALGSMGRMLWSRR